MAVIDADVWGFSIPRMLGITEPPSVVDDMLIPPVAHGVRSISMGFFAEEDQPVIWRGPMLHKALNQFLTDVAWDEPDFLLIDLPPGTGDTAISLAGNPVAADTSTEIGSIFAEIARVVEEDLKPTKRRHRELKIN